MKRRTLDYICMQPTRQGQASHAHVNEVVEGLRRRGWDVTLVEPSQPRSGRGDGLRRLTAVAAAQLSYWLQRRFRPARFVYIRSHFLALPTALLAWAAGSYVVQEVNGPIDDVFDSWPMLRPLGRLVALAGWTQLRIANAVVVPTPGFATYVDEGTGRGDRCHVVGNGANVEHFRPRPDPDLAGARRHVVFLGALASWQGVDTILAAAADPAWPDGVDLLIAGDGRERDRVLEATQTSPHVRWLGNVPYDQAPALVSGSMAALVPMSDSVRSRWGLSPLKLYEAMACGIPVVASDLPGLGDTVREHDCGITFPPGDHHAMAQAVARLAADPVLGSDMGSRGRRAAELLYSWDARAGQTQEVLLDAARRRLGARKGGGTRPG